MKDNERDCHTHRKLSDFYGCAVCFVGGEFLNKPN